MRIFMRRQQALFGGKHIDTRGMKCRCRPDGPSQHFPLHVCYTV